LSKRVGAATLVLLVVTGAACSSGDDDGRPTVVATTTILGDIVAGIVGPDASVDVLMPIGAAPHDFRPSSAQIAQLVGADLVVANGLGLEQGLQDALESAASDGANVMRIAPLLDPLPFGSSGNGDPAVDAGDLDPHVWLDPLRMARAADLIASELAAVEPAVDWQQRAALFAERLSLVDVEIVGILSAVPAGRRLLATTHESLGYFADRYGFEIIGVVVPGGSTLADPSPADLARLVEKLTTRNVPAIFAENTEPVALADAVAAEVGAGIGVVELYVGSLGEPESDGATLIDLLLTNARRIAAALG